MFSPKATNAGGDFNDNFFGLRQWSKGMGSVVTPRKEVNPYLFD